MEGTGPGQHGRCYSIHILKRKEEADQQLSSSLEFTLPSHNNIVSLMGPRMTREMSLWA